MQVLGIAIFELCILVKVRAVPRLRNRPFPKSNKGMSRS